MAEPPEVPELTCVIRAETPRNLITKLDKLALEHKGSQFTKARTAWQTDLQVEINDDMWRYCCANTKKVSLNGRHRLVHFKFLQRVYYTPEHLHRYGLRQSAECERCHEPVADFMHLAWYCPGVLQYWVYIFTAINTILDLQLTPDPALALLGYSRGLPVAVRRLTDMGMLIARRVVARCWMRGPLPTAKRWANDMLYCCTQSELYSDLLPPMSQPKNFWGLYLTHFKAGDTNDDAGIAQNGEGQSPDVLTHTGDAQHTNATG